ncbi:MAG: SDR family oxidoreductase [Trueperaceae bacterium]
MILLTGGNGRLGKELQNLLTLGAPSSQDLDITSLAKVQKVFEQHKPTLLVHAAAYTNVSSAESEKTKCWQVNVEGTRNLVKVASQYNVPFVHISTDYVFYGDKGNYKEGDALGPVRNYYALTKLVAEELVRLAPKHLVIRTSFRPREWPYPSAFDDVYTSQDYVDIIAPEIALAVQNAATITDTTLHIATERKSVYDLAQRRKADVARGSKASANVPLPDDISLDISRWQELKKTLKGGMGNEE